MKIKKAINFVIMFTVILTVMLTTNIVYADNASTPLYLGIT